ncbi:hypothetical protein AVEN_157659-1 [Araneus ventricosus]|uniref:Uncharacterized protein n=1 Tax=Araneus ventricosus TaxID=182803 RepID=A0A4Y1ZLE2_ARAVE|nr:hypothetical protein AVEN_157659-1 [Araneus ventricosus]
MCWVLSSAEKLSFEAPNRKGDAVVSVTSAAQPPPPERHERTHLRCRETTPPARPNFIFQNRKKLKGYRISHGLAHTEGSETVKVRLSN